MNVKEFIITYVGQNIRRCLLEVDDKTINSSQEIRIRVDKPLYIIADKKEFFVSEDGIVNDEEKAYKPSKTDILTSIELMSDYSTYAFEEEIKRGYITLPHGFRVGIAGKIIIENDCVKSMKNISSLNIRICKEVKGCSEKVIKYIYDNKVRHTLIISPPNCGKTTLLRDVIKSLSDKGFVVGVVDERSEIAGTYMGVIQNDVGKRTDVLDACPKAKGMMMLLRSMSPNIIAVDEIGRQEDIIAIDNVINCGVKIIATVHGEDIEDITRKETLNKLIKKNIFERFIVLSDNLGVGSVKGIYDVNFKELI